MASILLRVTSPVTTFSPLRGDSQDQAHLPTPPFAAFNWDNLHGCRPSSSHHQRPLLSLRSPPAICLPPINHAVAILQTTLPSCFGSLQKPGPQRWALSILTPTSITTKLLSPPTSTAQGARCAPSLSRTLTDSSGPIFFIHGTSSLSVIFPGT
jgi:hypothetical protein